MKKVNSYDSKMMCFNILNDFLVMMTKLTKDGQLQYSNKAQTKIHQFVTKYRKLIV